MKPNPRVWQITHKLLLATYSLMSLGLLVWTFFTVLKPDCQTATQTCADLPWDLVTPLVALGFWVVGLVIWKWDQTPVIIVFFFVSSAALAVGLLSGLGSDPAGRLFYTLMAWLSPVMVQFHLVWAMLPKRRLEKGVLAGFFYLLLHGQFLLFCTLYLSFRILGGFPSCGWGFAVR